MILVTFAVPQESGAFIDRLRHSGSDGSVVLGNLGVEEVAVAHTGIGAAGAREMAERLLGKLRPRRVIGAGFAGGLDPALATGELIAARNVSTAALPPGIRAVHLASAPAPLETPAAKAQLRTSGADAVDLESAALAAACAGARTPLLVLRVISDDAGEPLPLPAETAYDLARQRPRPLAVLRHLQHHPADIAPLLRFVQRLPMLQRVLADAIESAICL